ncbi:DUF3108 domain-containing protein [Cytophagaceae bacterium ABcell3]|nr:DUF3108 domain-containing protein [Cytophagaceae bacterium ABcell3]
MKRLFLLPGLLFILMSFTVTSDLPENTFDYQDVEQKNFAQGEVLKYKVHYGIIKAGEATMELSPKLYKVNDRVCYKATVFGRSTGAFDLMLRIRDTWGSYIDSDALVPQRSFRNIEEGKYRYKETVNYDHAGKRVEIEADKKGTIVHDTLEIKPSVQDMVSGYYYLRTLDFDSYETGDTLTVDAFFEDKLYDFKLKYMGKGEVSTKFGKVDGILLTPIMPDNDLFKGGESIKFWVTDDKNRIPIKIEAELFLGSVAMDLEKYEGLRHPVNFRKK